MLEITKRVEGQRMQVALTGRLDVNAAEQLNEALLPALDDVDELTIDLGGLEYLSSAGMRVFLKTYHTLQAQGGTLKVQNATEPVQEVLSVTGFWDFLIAE